MTQSNKSSKSKSHPFWKFFWLTFLVASLAYAWYSFYAPSNNIEWVKKSSDSQSITNNSNKNTILFFTGKWCSPCRIMKREVFSDKEVESIINENFTPVIIDIDDAASKETVEKYQVGATPTTIFVDSKGEVLDYVVGKVGKEKFLEMLSQLDSK